MPGRLFTQNYYFLLHSLEKFDIVFNRSAKQSVKERRHVYFLILIALRAILIIPYFSRKREDVLRPCAESENIQTNI